LEVLQHGHHVLPGFALQAIEFGTLVQTEKQITRHTRHVWGQKVVCEYKAASKYSS